MKDSEFYVTGMAASQFIHGAKMLGLDAGAAMEHAQLQEEHLIPTAQVPESQYERLILWLDGASNNDCVGADIGQQLILPLYGPLISLSINAPRLDQAIKNLVRFTSLATGNCGGIEYRIIGSSIELSVASTHKNPIVRRHVSECVFVFLLGLIRLISANPDLSFDEVWLEHCPHSNSTRKRLESVLGCTIEWEKTENKIFISQQTHNIEIIGHGQEYLRAAELQAEQQLEKITQQNSWLDRVKWHITDLMLSSAPRRKTVANRLKISTRTLDRRLEQSGVSWQQLVDNARLDRATKLLVDPGFTIAEITEKVGFKDIRSFQRRFKSWTGVTPSSYRKQNQHGEDHA